MARIQDGLPGGESTDLVLVHHRDGGLSAADREATAAQVAEAERSPSAPAAAGPECLSDRGCEVLTLVARGLNNAEIADSLGLSPLTAKTHVSRTMGKLGVRDRARLVIVAYESGLVAPGRA